VRGFNRNGQTFKLQVFKGTITEWVQNLSDAAYPPLMERMSGTEPEAIRKSYIKRDEYVRAEAEKLSKDRKDVYVLLDSLERDLRFLNGGRP
jgi:hypothetical protein